MAQRFWKFGHDLHLGGGDISLVPTLRVTVTDPTGALLVGQAVNVTLLNGVVVSKNTDSEGLVFFVGVVGQVSVTVPISGQVISTVTPTGAATVLVISGQTTTVSLGGSAQLAIAMVIPLLAPTTPPTSFVDTVAFGVSVVAVPFWQKTFFAAGLFWVFYYDGTNMVYKTAPTSTPLVFSAKNVIRAVSATEGGNEFSVWFDGTFLHYAAVPVKNATLFYRRGTPKPDGTIAWSQPEQNVVGVAAYPSIAVDSNGFPWIGYQTSTTTDAVTKSSTNDGTWVTQAGFPFAPTGTQDARPIPLTGGKMGVLSETGSINTSMFMQVWNGSSFNPSVNLGPASDLFAQGSDAMAIVGDDIHFVYLQAATFNIIYLKFTFATNSVSAPITVQGSTTSKGTPTISNDTALNKLYVFWKDAPTPNHYFYKKFDVASATFDTSPTDWIDESVDGIYDGGEINSFFKMLSNTIGVEYTTGPAGAVKVKLAYLSR